jgi:glucose/arabinose dehydrogenase
MTSRSARLIHLVAASVAACIVGACTGSGETPAASSPSAPAASVAAAVPAAGLPPPLATPPALRFSTVIGWPAGRMPIAPAGFQVSLFADALANPRWLHVLPNGDVLVAESMAVAAPPGLPPDIIDGLRRSRIVGDSANRITLLRDANGDAVPEVRTVFLSGLQQPFGMLHMDGSLLVANTDGLVRYPYRGNETRIDAAGQKLLDLPAGGYNNHWTRNVVARPDGSKLYVSVGSATNVDEESIDVKDPRRAAILEVNPDGTGMRVYASGLRNPNGMDWEPTTTRLWTTVNERDMLGDDLVPDYLTGVRDGGFYGWPYSYFGANEDPRQKGKRPDLVATAIVPDYSLGAHTASLGLLFSRGTLMPESYRGGAFIAQRGSWNRSALAGYRVIFVPFSGGRPSGSIQDFLTGFIANEQTAEVYGRPVGLAMLRDGSLLVADDGGGKIWRVSAASR